MRDRRQNHMTLKRALMVLVLVALAALSGCGSNGGKRDRDAVVDPGLGPVTYVVTRVTVGGKPHALVKGTEVRIGFAGGKVTLTAGCNTMSGGYLLEESRLTVEQLATTEMGCDRPRMEQDTWLAGLFAKPVQLTTGSEPTIVAGSTVLAMADRKTVHPDLSLVGTRWTLDTITNAGVASSVPSDQSGSLSITGHSVVLHDGCNVGSGTVSIAKTSLTFRDIVMTMRPCPSSNQVSPAFAQMFAGTVGYVIQENRLTLSSNGHGLGFTGAR